MKLNQPIQAVIFDFDGVIADTEPLHYASFNQVVVPGGMGCTWEEYQQHYMGFDDRDLFREAYRRKGQRLTDDQIKTLLDEKADAFVGLVAKGVAPYVGIPEVVQGLAEHLPLALCSGALRSDIEPVLRLFQLDTAFPVQVTAEDVPRSKPDPTCYCLAVDRLAVHYQRLFEPDACVAVEDTPAGISAAREAGLHVVAVTHTHHRSTLEAADAIYDSLPAFAADYLNHG